MQFGFEEVSEKEQESNKRWYQFDRKLKNLKIGILNKPARILKSNTLPYKTMKRCTTKSKWEIRTTCFVRRNIWR